jgi:signal transduction histidine kinase
MTQPLENSCRSANEGERLSALRQYSILDTPASAAYDRITVDAARLCSAPMAVISFVDEDRVWFKSHFGFGLQQVAREGFFCSQAILSDEIFIVEDAAADPRFAACPCVAGSPGVRFYAGIPLKTSGGFRLGALAILDTEAREAPVPEQEAVLRGLAALVIAELELGRLTERAAEAERSRRRAGRLPASAFENAPAAMAVIGADGALVAANRRYCALAGREPAELIGAPPAFDGPACGADGRPVEWRVRRSDGFEATLLAAMSPIEGSGMAALAALDLSEELERRSSIGWLETTEALSRMAGEFAHDFNNLLMIIMGFSQLLKNNLDPNDPLAAFAEDILKAGDRAAALTARFLTFSGRRVGRPELLNLNELLASMSNRLREIAGARIEVVAECAPGLAQIKADSAHLGKAIEHLVSNAAEAMPGGGKISITTSMLEPDAAWLRMHPGMKPAQYCALTIRDGGAGMDGETLKRLCEPFFSTRQGHEGCGLSAVYGTVKQCGGTMSVASAPGKGTAVSVYLPAVLA